MGRKNELVIKWRMLKSARGKEWWMVKRCGGKKWVGGKKGGWYKIWMFPRGGKSTGFGKML